MQETTKTTNGQDTSTIGRLFENLAGYIDTKMDLFKLDVQLKIRDAVVNTMHIGVLAFTGFLTLLFFSITLGLALNDLLDSSFLGFAIVTVIFLIPFVIALTNKDKTMFRKVADGMFEKTDEQEGNKPKADASK